MLRPTSRRLFAVLTAIIVICSVGGTPAAAMASDDTGLTDNGVTAGFESPNDSESEGDGEADGDETDDTEREDTEDGDMNDTDDEDNETDDGEAGDTGDSDTEDADDGEADDADDGEADDADTHRESGTQSYRVVNDSETIAERDEVTGNMSESTASLLRTNEDDDDVIGPVDGLEAEPDEVRDLPDEEVVSTTDTVDVKALSLSIGDFELPLFTYEDPAYGAAPESADDAALDAADSSAHLRAVLTTDSRGVDGDRGIVFGSSDDAGDGGEPLPPAPGGAVALGTLAAAAAVRSSPFVATEGARAASSTGTSLLSSLLEKVRPFVFPLRYSRYDDSDPLEHEAREQVYAIVNEEPGSYLSEVSEEADLPLSTTRHHIKILEREELVSGAKLRGKRRFYPAYAEGIELAAALNDDSTATILDALTRFGAASVSDLAEELERDPSTISHHLQRLEEDDIVTRERDGRAVVTRLSSEARTALEPETTPRPPETEEALAGGAD